MSTARGFRRPIRKLATKAVSTTSITLNHASATLVKFASHSRSLDYSDSTLGEEDASGSGNTTCNSRLHHRPTLQSATESSSTNSMPSLEPICLPSSPSPSCSSADTPTGNIRMLSSSPLHPNSSATLPAATTSKIRRSHQLREVKKASSLPNHKASSASEGCLYTSSPSKTSIGEKGLSSFWLLSL